MDKSIFLADLETTVARAVEEDLGERDLSAELIDAKTICEASIITRQDMILCGIDWVNETFHQIDSRIVIDWNYQDGDTLVADSIICTLSGPARSLLTGERTALNFLQTLSATATTTRRYTDRIAHTSCRLLDTRKTLPGLRKAQKYAVKCGGGSNHRMGLYDAYLIKENHIAACGSIAAAIERARQLHPDKWVEVEVENLEELQEAVAAGPDQIMLDNFSLADLMTAVALVKDRTRLEASGGIESEHELIKIAETGVHFISLGALTKHVRAVDLSMRILRNK